MRTLVRFRGLRDYGVNNWVTLGRWIRDEGFPAGFYLAKNTRAWYKDDCDAWLASRPKADPPPDIKQRPAPKVAAEGNGPLKALAGNQSNPTDKRIESFPQVLANGRAGA